MSPARAWATAVRVLAQLRHDPRTLALLLVVPSGLLALMSVMYDQPAPFSAAATPTLVLVPLVMMFLVTSVTMLRERTSGTLERLLTTPLTRLELVTGYGIAFGAVAVAQSSALTAFGLGVLDLQIAGPVELVLALAAAAALLGVGMGLALSGLATTEFQALQMLPATLLPQLLLSGLLVPRERLPGWLETIADVLPLSFALDATRSLATSAEVSEDVLVDLAIITGIAVAALAAGAATLRRRTA
jgi:ABC-2 type transport system permease protein